MHRIFETYKIILATTRRQMLKLFPALQTHKKLKIAFTYVFSVNEYTPFEK